MSKTILIVDDDNLITTTLSTLIEITFDYNVLISNNPIEALEMGELKNNKIDLIISDFLMPELNGLEFLKKASELCPQAILILLTGYADKQNAIRCINELGIYYYLEKPWDNEVLIKIMQNALEKKTLREELDKKLVELETSNSEISRLYKLLESAYNIELNKNEELNQWNQKLEQAVADRTVALRSLLDNANQGFLSFDENLIIHSQYSRECIKIFGQDIQNKSFAEVLYPDDVEQRKYLSVMLRSIFQKKNDPRFNVYISLLPQEVILRNRYISIAYKLIKSSNVNYAESLMVILTDITDKKALENKIEEERNILRMVVKAIIYHSELTDCINDYFSFCHDKINIIIQKPQPMEDTIFELFRQIHTYKGSFSQLDMTSVSAKLHTLENQLSELKSKSNAVTIEMLKNLLAGSEMEKWLNPDLNILREYLGNEFFFKKDLVFVDKSKLLYLENKIISLLPPSEYRLILPDIRQLRYKSFKELLKSYPDYVMQLSSKMDKPIRDFSIEGEDILIDADKYCEFTKTLIHMFRNILDHGIEAAEDRIRMGKDCYGNIRCRVSKQYGNIMLSISDDGNGIAPDEVKQKAISKNIISIDEANRLTAEEAVMLIFKNGFSTNDQVNDISGRGVGLSAVLEKLNALKGTVNIITTPHAGTEFCFTLPYEELYIPPTIHIETILEPVIKAAKKLIHQYSDTEFENENDYTIKKAERLMLREYTSFISIKGAVRGIFLISISEELVQDISHKFVLDDFEPRDKDLHYEDILAEFSNTILGNSINSISDTDNLAVLNPPITICSSSAVIKYSESIIWTHYIMTANGELSISLITTHEANIV